MGLFRRNARGSLALRHALVVFCAAAALRIAYLVEMHNTPVFEMPQIDEDAYDQQALGILAGHWPGQRVFYQDPLYPYFLAATYRVFGHHLMLVRLVQVLIGSVNCVLVYFLAREVCWSRAALVAGLLSALYRTFIFQEALILKSSLVLATLDAALLLFLWGQRTRRWFLWLGAGLTLGLGMLVRANYVFFVPVAFLWTFVANREQGVRQAAPRAILIAAGLCAAILPVTIRNWFVAHDFVLTTWQGGTNFYTAHHEENLTGTLVPPRFIHAVPAFEDRDFWLEAERLAGRKIEKASEVSRFWFHKGLESIRQQPRLFLYRTWKKLRYATTDYEPPDNQSIHFTRRYFSRILMVTPVSFGLVFPFAAVGLVLALRERRPVGLLMGFLTSYMVSLLVFYVFERTRLPLVPPLIVLAAFGGVRMWELRTAITLRLGIVLGTVFVASALWAWIPAERPDPAHLAQAWRNYAASYAVRGRWDDAEKAYRSALELSPDFAVAHYGLGAVARHRRHLSEAEHHLRTAIRLDDALWFAHAELAGVLRETGRYDEAESHARRSIRLYPYAPVAHLELGRVLVLRGRFVEAEDAYREALKLDAESLAAHLELGQVLSHTGQREGAREHLRRALELATDEAHRAKARSLLESLDR